MLCLCSNSHHYNRSMDLGITSNINYPSLDVLLIFSKNTSKFTIYLKYLQLNWRTSKFSTGACLFSFPKEKYKIQIPYLYRTNINFTGDQNMNQIHWHSIRCLLAGLCSWSNKSLAPFSLLLMIVSEFSSHLKVQPAKSFSEKREDGVVL